MVRANSSINEHCSTTENSNPGDLWSRLETYFKANGVDIQARLEQKRTQLGPKYTDELDLDSITAELALRLSNKPLPLINDELIRETLNDVINDKGLDPQSKKYASKTRTVSNMGKDSSDQESTTGAARLLHEDQMQRNPATPTEKKLRKRDSQATITIAGETLPIPKLPSCRRRLNWNRLNSKQEYLILVASLFGSRNADIARDLGLKPTLVKNTVSRARRKIGLSSKAARSISKQNRSKAIKSDPAKLRDRTLDWLFPDSSINDEAREQKYSLIQDQFSILNQRQQTIANLYIEGHSPTQIAKQLKTTRASVTSCLRQSKIKLSKRLDELQKHSCPQGVVFDKWLKLQERSRTIYEDYAIKGLSEAQLTRKYDFQTISRLRKKLKDISKILGIAYPLENKDDSIVIIAGEKLPKPKITNINTVIDWNKLNSKRQYQVLVAIMQGKSISDISTELGIDRKAVIEAASKARAKLGIDLKTVRRTAAHNRAENQTAI